MWTYKESPKIEWKRWFVWYSVPVGKNGEERQFPIQDGDLMVRWKIVERKWMEYRESNSYAYRLPKL